MNEKPVWKKWFEEISCLQKILVSKKLNNLERFYAKNERRLTNTTEAARATSATKVHFI